MSRTEFNTDAEYRAQLFKELIEIVHELGWEVGIPKGPADEEVPGMVIGKPAYVRSKLGAKDAGSTKANS
jgi:hypothetical protein